MYKVMEWSRNVLRYGIGFFRHCETFSRFSSEFFFPKYQRGYLLRRGLIMTPAVNCFTRGYCFDLMHCEKILRQCVKIGYNSVI